MKKTSLFCAGILCALGADCAVGQQPYLQMAESHEHCDHEQHEGSGVYRIGDYRLSLLGSLDVLGSYARKSDVWNGSPRLGEISAVLEHKSGWAGVLGWHLESDSHPSEKNRDWDPHQGLDEWFLLYKSHEKNMQFRVGQYQANVFHFGPYHLYQLPFANFPRIYEMVAGSGTLARGAEISFKWPEISGLSTSWGASDRIWHHAPQVSQLLHNEDDEHGSHGHDSVFENHREYDWKAPVLYSQWAKTWKVSRLSYGQTSFNGLWQDQRNLVASMHHSWSWQKQEDGVRWQLGAEFFASEFKGDIHTESDGLESYLLRTQGAYAYAICHLNRKWAIGLRGDWVQGNRLGEIHEDEAHEDEEHHAEYSKMRQREHVGSAFVQWQPSVNQRYRLAVEKSDAQANDWTVMLQCSIQLGDTDQSCCGPLSLD